MIQSLHLNDMMVMAYPEHVDFMAIYIYVYISVICLCMCAREYVIFLPSCVEWVIMCVWVYFMLSLMSLSGSHSWLFLLQRYLTTPLSSFLTTLSV